MNNIFFTSITVMFPHLFQQETEMLGLTSVSINRPSIQSSLSDRNKPDTKSQARRINITPPPQPPSVPTGKQQIQKKPSVAEIERAIGAGIFKDRDINRESEQEKTLFDQILSNSIGKTEGDVEKKLRETGEWIIDQTEGPSRSTEPNLINGKENMDENHNGKIETQKKKWEGRYKRRRLLRNRRHQKMNTNTISNSSKVSFSSQEVTCSNESTSVADIRKIGEQIGLSWNGGGMAAENGSEATVAL